MVKDDQRQRELGATLKVAAETSAAHASAPLLIMLGSTLFVNARKAQEERTEFDGVWAFFERDRVVWYFLEHKKSASAESALRAKLAFFSSAASTYDITSDVRGKAAAAILTFPHAAA
jgi:hypothetical protein